MICCVCDVLDLFIQEEVKNASIRCSLICGNNKVLLGKLPSGNFIGSMKVPSSIKDMNCQFVVDVIHENVSIGEACSIINYCNVECMKKSTTTLKVVLRKENRSVGFLRISFLISFDARASIWNHGLAHFLYLVFVGIIFSLIFLPNFINDHFAQSQRYFSSYSSSNGTSNTLCYGIHPRICKPFQYLTNTTSSSLVVVNSAQLHSLTIEIDSQSLQLYQGDNDKIYPDDAICEVWDRNEEENDSDEAKSNNYHDVDENKIDFLQQGLDKVKHFILHWKQWKANLKQRQP